MNEANKKLKRDSITIEYGAGGRKMHRLIRELLGRYFTNPILDKYEDAAEIDLKAPHKFCITIDSYVVQPLFFPGGDIGKLSICGTANDLAVKGSRPRYIALSFVIKEGLSLRTLEKISRSMARTAEEIKVLIVTGDTKVIEKNPVNIEKEENDEEIIVTTCGVGEILPVFNKAPLGVQNIKEGDMIIINGSIGEHEAAVLLARNEFKMKGQVKSDCQAVYPLIEVMAKNNCQIKMMRDPTRGGLATTLNEIADDAGISIFIDENKIPVLPEVRGLAELLGLDPLYMANEGKVVVVVKKDDAERTLTIMKKHPLGKSSAIIGEVKTRYHGLGVWLKTKIGSLRPVLQLEGSQLPRIC
jgi:hydrogenase expression/formation protein HypE